MSDAEIYNLTVKMFGSQAEPPFESASELENYWGRQWGCDNDVGQLRVVLMHRPDAEFDVIDASKRIESIGSYGDLEKGWYFQSDTLPQLADMQAQHDKLTGALRAEGVEVIDLEGVDGHRFKSCYTRDSSISVRGGNIVTRLAPRMRRGEELAVTRTLAKLGVPVLRTICGSGLFEGGSFAWLNPTNAVVGRSIRCNDEGIEQIAEVLKHQGVELHVVDMNGYSIHIDGSFLMIDKDLALVEATGLNYVFLQKLKSLGIHTIETSSKDNTWIINGLAVRPGRVLVPLGASDATREALFKAGVELVEVAYDKVQHNGGGIHCSTCPLIRDPV